MVLVACASGGSSHVSPASEGGTGECTVELPARSATAVVHETKALIRAGEPSLIVVNAEVALLPLAQTLGSRIKQRLAEGRAGIGLGGTVTYSVDRGALALSVTKTALVVEAPVQARAEACRGRNCYASCEPEARVRAEVSLLLGADYRFKPAVVSLRFTKGCKVQALGGLLTVDVTPTIENELEPELAKVSKEIDRQMPDVRGEVEKAWAELATPRALPLLGCVLVQPSGVVQGPLLASNQVLRARFAIRAMPELRSDCGATAAPPPLPPLVTDLSLPDDGVVQLGLVTPLSALAHASEAAATQVAGKRVRATRATATARGSDVDLDLVLGGDVCGNLAFSASPDFSGAGQFIGLKSASLVASERERLTKSELEPDHFVRALSALPQVAPLLSVSGFREAAPTLASALSQPSLDVSAKIVSTRAAGAAARGPELVAWLEARGSITLKRSE